MGGVVVFLPGWVKPCWEVGGIPGPGGWVALWVGLVSGVELYTAAVGGGGKEP